VRLFGSPVEHASGLSRIILLVRMARKASIYAALPAWSQEK
jgi:hypothetical protein